MSAGAQPPDGDWIVAPAGAADLPEIAALVNSAYRGEAARAGWSHEADLLGGQRTDPQTLAGELAGANEKTLLCLRERAEGPILACVMLAKIVAPAGGMDCYLGMLSVAPKLQDRRVGRIMLARAEDHARAWGAERVIMTVIHLRAALIAWYERRGYRRTGETQPFPYGDARFGLPRRDDLHFVVLDKPL